MQGKESVLAALQCRGLEAGEHCRGEDGLATPFWQFESALSPVTPTVSGGRSISFQASSARRHWDRALAARCPEWWQARGMCFASYVRARSLIHLLMPRRELYSRYDKPCAACL